MISMRVHLRALLFAAVCVLIPTLAHAEQVSEDPLERRMLEIAKDLRCAVCQNQPISESNADLARDMREIIREQLKAGKSRNEIVQYFVDRYGDYVLLRPPVQGPGFMLWVLPLVVAGGLALAAFVYLRHRRREQLPSPPPILSDEDRRRIEQARNKGEE
jgi:cytochrome c-type biogenesis protein CcmH